MLVSDAVLTLAQLEAMQVSQQATQAKVHHPPLHSDPAFWLQLYNAQLNELVVGKVGETRCHHSSADASCLV